MAKAKITTEQRERLDKFVGGIGHNQGPVLEPYTDSISEHLVEHHGLRAEATRIRVILDLMRSHLAGDYLLSKEKTAYVFGLVGILATITAGTAIVMFTIPAILLDVAVVVFIIAGLRDEIKQRATEASCLGVCLPRRSRARGETA